MSKPTNFEEAMAENAWLKKRSTASECCASSMYMLLLSVLKTHRYTPSAIGAHLDQADTELARIMAHYTDDMRTAEDHTPVQRVLDAAS